jgi:hypothetical protein
LHGFQKEHLKGLYVYATSSFVQGIKVKKGFVLVSLKKLALLKARGRWGLNNNFLFF